MTQNDSSGQFQTWVQGRITLAKRLDWGECGGSYGDAMLILSALLSGQAADIWPGKNKDRRRFVEIWATLSNKALTPNLISVPLLIGYLEKNGKPDLVKKVKDTNSHALALDETMVVTGKQVDLPEEDLMKLDPRLTAKCLRRFSYGSVFYEHVRSGYTHEYHTTDSASSRPQAREPAPISYVNVLRRSDYKTHRRIHFDVGWVAEVVESISTSAVVSGLKQSLADPTKWWIDG